MNRPRDAQATKTRICRLLDELSEDDLLLIERFVILTHRQASGQGAAATETGSETVRYLYPTVFIPAAALGKLVGIVSVGGDALADSEALYDEV